MTIVEAYQVLSNVRGRVVIIDELPINKGRLIKASAFGIQVKVDLSEAQHMREAYLTRDKLIFDKSAPDLSFIRGTTIMLQIDRLSGT